MDKDEGEGCGIDIHMCFRWGDVSCPEPNDVEWSLEQIRVSVHVKDADEQIVQKQRLYNLKMQKGSDEAWVKIDDKNKSIILICSLPCYYNHLVTTLTYEKDTISFVVITTTLFSFSKKRKCRGMNSKWQSVCERGQNHGWNKGNGGSEKKRSESKNKKINEYAKWALKKRLFKQ